MRITVLDDDPGRKINPNRELYTVYLDDKEIKYCLTADDEKGEVITIETDEQGRMLAENGEVKRLVAYGQVRILRK